MDQKVATLVKNNKGFSLVELMVVVAIIGVLATIAIPRVNKFIAKSRQSEAQVNLSSIYTFNKNFFLEYQGYTNSFDAMGYQSEGNLRYNIGWAIGAAVGPANYTSLTGKAYAGNTDTLTDCPQGGAVCQTLMGADNQLPRAVSGTSLAADFTSFVAGANACLVSSGGGCTDDQWTMNQDKSLRNTQSGID